MTGSRTVRRDRGRRCGRVSPEDAILNVRHLLEAHALTERLFAVLNGRLADQGIAPRSGIVVDGEGVNATGQNDITNASTNNEARSATAASPRPGHSSSRRSPSAICSSSDDGCSYEAEAALRCRSWRSRVQIPGTRRHHRPACRRQTALDPKSEKPKQSIRRSLK